MRNAVLVALAVLGGAMLPSGAAAQDGLAIIEIVASRYRLVGTLCADFEQRFEVPLLGTERTGSGRVCQARPNLFAMRFSDPEGDVIVADGESVWVYLPSNDPRNVLKTPADESAGGRDFHREFLENPDAKYDVTYEGQDEVAGRTTHRLRLVPKVRRGYRSAVLWLDDDVPVLRQIRLEEENGNVRTITFSNIEFEARPGDDFFRFTPPPGAVVIRG